MKCFQMMLQRFSYSLVSRYYTSIAALVLIAVFLQLFVPTQLMATTPATGKSNFLHGTSNESAKREAAQSIPLEKISPDDRARIEAVIANASIFRRMPIRVVDCDPGLYLFLVRHPDVVVNIWDVLKLSELRLRQIDEDRFHIAEKGGTTADVRFVYQSHDLHVLYGEGVYDGPVLARPVTGKGVLILKCGYVQETNGRYYITSRLDCFLTIEPLSAELLGKVVTPFFAKTVDNNFIQTVAFVGNLSRTAEVNRRGIERLTSHLTYVRPEVRHEFLELTAKIADRYESAEASWRPNTDNDAVAVRATESVR